MNCKDCYHCKACEEMCDNILNWEEEEICDRFKDKSRIVELPCKVGDRAYFFGCVCDEEGKEKFDIENGEVVSLSHQNDGLWMYCRYKSGLTYWHKVEKDFGKKVFLAREEAEEALRKEQER